MTPQQPRPPFSPGSICLGLHVHSELPLDRMVSTLREQARAGEAAGFDGVTLSEHHAGFPSYAPNPLLWSAILLGELEHAWAGPCPTLLPLRPAGGLIEDLAWLAAAYPGRVAAGFAAGYQEQDFAALHSDFASRAQRYWEALPQVVAALSGNADTVLRNDPAIAALSTAPVSVVSGAGGPVGAQRAARAGAGLLITSLTDPRRARELVDAHGEAAATGGTSSTHVLIRRPWVGTRPGTLQKNIEQYQSAGDNPSWLLQTDRDPLIAGDAAGIVDRIAGDAHQAGISALNLRVHLHGVAPELVLEQIAELGRNVLPPLRAALAQPV
jgi:alkanesulfonate monooxygenase SsuD/methylene tetrahydromethanopterin reductase-like flavin-dependent oxidoreductase (luciferase family)